MASRFMPGGYSSRPVDIAARCSRLAAALQPRTATVRRNGRQRLHPIVPRERAAPAVRARGAKGRAREARSEHQPRPPPGACPADPDPRSIARETGSAAPACARRLAPRTKRAEVHGVDRLEHLAPDPRREEIARGAV